MADRARKSIGAQRNPASEAAILAAARELLAEEGLAGFSIEAVARRARAGKPTIYRWWPDKTRLLLAAYQGLKEELPEPDTGSLEGDLRSFLTNLFAFWRTTPAGPVFRSILAEAQTNAEAGAAFSAYHQTRLAMTAANFARNGLALEKATLLAELAVNYAWGQLLSGRLDPGAEEIADVAAMLVAGCRAVHRPS